VRDLAIMWTLGQQRRAHTEPGVLAGDLDHLAKLRTAHPPHQLLLIVSVE
jgi:hypothetical protein